jgi:Fe-S-cluster containining protein
MQVGISTLSLEQQGEIHRAIQAATAASGFVVCPLLDLKHGLCTIYEVRPIACRTYGYYDQRGIGLYCKDIEQDVAEGRLDDVVWGSQEGVALDLKRLGPQRSLDEWLCARLDSKT